MSKSLIKTLETADFLEKILKQENMSMELRQGLFIAGANAYPDKLRMHIPKGKGRAVLELFSRTGPLYAINWAWDSVDMTHILIPHIPEIVDLVMETITRQ